MRKIISILCLLAVHLCALSIPATRQPILRVAEDGSCDTVFLHGDEFYHFYTDRHGNIIEGSEYRDEALIQQATNRRRAPQKILLNSYVPSQGTVHIPVILVNFTDLSFTISDPISRFSDFFNGSGGSNPNATGSVHTYYSAASNGLLDLQYDVHGVYTLSHDMAYYGSNKKNSAGTIISHNVHAKELVTEAVQLAVANGVDLSPYDNNHDGVIDNVSIVVAGYNEAEGGLANTIWPHYSEINQSSPYQGMYISGYLVISEYRSSGGKIQAGIGTYCHEFGHALGLPDLYDTDNSNAYTVGEWDIMCSGSYNNNGSTPPTYSAFERFAMGWLIPEQITTSGMYTLEPLATSNQAFLIASKAHNLDAKDPSPSEYFMIENRQPVGWDAGKDALVGSGLLISHITFSQIGWRNNTFNNMHPLGYDIVSAGSSSPTHSSAADVFPGSTLRNSWTPTFNNGNTMDSMSFTQIRQRGDLSMSMQIGGDPDKMLAFDAESVIVKTSYFNAPWQYDTACVSLHIPAIKYDSIRLYLSAAQFQFSIDSGLHWYSNQDTAWVHITRDSTYSIPVRIIYQPTRQNCEYTYAFLSAETADAHTGAQLTLMGSSPRPTFITTPMITGVTNLSSSLFNVQWEPQEDAEYFYYMLYTISEGDSEEIESFDNFDTLENIRDAGWEANFSNTQTIISQSGKAILYDRSGQYIQSPAYVFAPEAISIWISNNYTPNNIDSEIGGKLTLRASSDGNLWEDAATISVFRTTKNIVRTVELDTTRHWRQFRLSYTHTGGNGGTVIDDWTAHLSCNVQYLYRLKEYYIDGSGHEIVFRGLSPNTTYYYCMQSYEAKGCEPHYSPLSEPIAVHTLDVNENPKLGIARLGEGQYEIILPDMADGQHYINIYTYTGRLYAQLRPSYGTSRYTLPKLPLGQIYLIKYHTGTLHRKDINAKILSY